MFGIRYNVNTCDRIYNEIMVHFTSKCPNQCVYCIDKFNKGVNWQRLPNVELMCENIEKYKNHATCITISGGEPCMYMDELSILIDYIKRHTNLHITLITSLPSECYSKSDLFFSIIEKVDNLAISTQHFREDYACRIRGHQDFFDRQKFYEELPYKDKICINLNLINPWLACKEAVCKAIMHYNNMGYKNIRIAELSNRDEMYVSFEDIFGIKMESPFAHGCKTDNFDISKWCPDFNGNLTVKRQCFMNCNKLHANMKDIVKICTRNIFSKKHFFGVIYEDGNIYPYWQ